MVYHKTKASLKLSEEEKKALERIASSRTEEYRKVERAKILLAYDEKRSPMDIAISMNTNQQKVYRIINKALLLGSMHALDDLPGRGHPNIIENDARVYKKVRTRKPLSLRCG